MLDYEDVVKRLKPCAHCGRIINESNIFHQDYSGDIYTGDEYSIDCECGIGSVTFDKIEIIIENWNRRSFA